MSVLLLGGGRGPGTGGGGGGPSFTSPLDLTGLLGWWDASVFASLSLTSSDINSVADQSGNSRTMNWIGYGKPTYNATGFNSSYPSMNFTPAIAGYLTTGSGFPMGTGNTLTAWWVGTHTGSTAFGSDSGRMLSYAKPSSLDYDNAGSWTLARVTNSNATVQYVRNGTARSQSVTITNPHRHILTVDGSGVPTLYVDGVANTLGAIAGNWVSAGTFAIGADAQDSRLTYWVGPVAEAGVATGWHDATTAAALDTYLKTKWGL